MDSVFNRTRKIPSKSWGQECSLCSSRHGVPIECSARGCKAAYHTTCAIRAKLKMQAIFGKNYKGGIKLRSYCKTHSPTVKIENGTLGQDDKIDASGVKEIDMTNLVDERLQEGSEEMDYFWKYVDINEVHKSMSSQEVDPIKLDLIYRYWMLLRTANNGQSLIKFSPSALKEREFEQRKSILKLRIELERVRNLSYMIGKREKLKVGWLKTHQNIIKRTFGVINDLNPTNGMIDESEQLINDLIECDQIYDIPSTSTNTNLNTNLSYQERSTLERRRTLSLVRRINRQLKSVGLEPSMNPYARSYSVPKRSDSPTNAQTQQPSPSPIKVLKTR